MKNIFNFLIIYLFLLELDLHKKLILVHNKVQMLAGENRQSVRATGPGPAPANIKQLLLPPTLTL